MQSSLSFLLALKDFIQQNPDMPLKEIRMFWNRMDGRVSKRLSYQYGLLFKELGLKALDTVIPDMERYGRETSPEERILFRSTLFPPSGKLLKGSGLDTLAGYLSTGQAKGMRRKEFMNVNEERLKEIMAHETDADGCPKTHPDGIEKEEDRGKEGKESVSIPDGRTEKPTVFHKPAVRSGTSLAERMKTYRADYLSRREYVHRKQTYISYETYRRLARILPLLSEGMTVPAFLDNVLNRHLDEHGDVLDEMVRTGTRNSR